MKKLIVVFAAIAISATALFAQKNEKKNKSPEEKAQKIASRWKEYLGLTDEQKQKFYDAKLAQINKIKAFRDSTKGKERAGLGQKIKNNKDEFVATIKTILTPEQFDKWIAKRSEVKDKKENKKGKGKDKKIKDKEDSKVDSTDEDDN